jgi:hypothetical protein
MVISLIAVACCSHLGLINAIRVLFCKFYLRLHIRVTLSMLHRVDLLVFDRSFVPIVISIKFDPLVSSGLPYKFDLLLDRLSMNGLVGEVSLRFYRGV